MAAYHKLQKLGTKFRAVMWDKTGGRCWYCGLQTNPWRNFCIDHVDNHGDSTLNNLVPACRGCNRRKHNASLEEFRLRLTQQTIPTFSPHQLQYLMEIGCEIPSQFPTPEPHRFWFEEQGLTL